MSDSCFVVCSTLVEGQGFVGAKDLLAVFGIDPPEAGLGLASLLSKLTAGKALSSASNFEAENSPGFGRSKTISSCPGASLGSILISLTTCISSSSSALAEEDF